MKQNILGLTPVLLLVGGCMAPVPQPAAPVVDRSVYRQGPPPQPAEPARPAAEAVPLERPEPLTAERPQALDPTPIEPPSTPAGPSGPQSGGQQQGGQQQSSQAVAALLDSAASHVGSGEMDQAAGALERALRIEPNNATIWHDLGQIRLHQRQFSQAESMFDKSNSLAGNDRSLQARNWRMIAVARRAGGDTAGAEAAEARATVLER